MEMLKRLFPFALLIVFVGALNWGILGVFGTNVLAEILGTGTLLDVIYAVIGVAALVCLPKLVDELQGHHGGDPHLRGA